MRAGRGRELAIGTHRQGYEIIRSSVAPGVEVPVTSVPVLVRSAGGLRWLGWMLLAIMAVAFEPLVAVAATGVGAASLLVSPGPATDFAMGLTVLLAGAALGRLAWVLAPRLSRVMVGGAVAAVSLLAVFGNPTERLSWLPEHLLRPGWGGVWMVAMAWVVCGWPGTGRTSFSLGRRLRAATLLALLGLALHIVRVPVELSRAMTERVQVVLPRGDIELAGNLPASPDTCRLTDLAPVLAERWRLAEWQTPSELLLIDDMGSEISRWGRSHACGWRGTGASHLAPQRP